MFKKIIKFLVIVLLVKQFQSNLACMSEKDIKAASASGNYFSLQSISYSDVQKEAGLYQSEHVNKYKRKYYDMLSDLDGNITVMGTEIDQPEKVGNQDVINMMQAHNANQKLPAWKRVKQEDGTFKDVLTDKPYVPNGIRLEYLTGQYQICLKESSLLSNTNYYTSTYYPSIYGFLKKLSSIHSDSKAKNKDEKRRAYFASVARFFYRVMEMMEFLHNKEFLDGDRENISQGSSEFVVKNLTWHDIGIRDKGFEDKDTFPDGYAVIRDPLNVYNELSVDDIKKLAKQYKFAEKNFYDRNEQQNINYIQVFDLFMEVVSYLGEKNYLVFLTKDYKVEFSQCFEDREAIEIFTPTKCPMFLLQALDMITFNSFNHFYQVIVRRDLTKDAKKTRLILAQIFHYLKNWGTNVQMINSFHPEPDYTIISERKKKNFLQTKENEPGFFSRFFSSIGNFFKNLWNKIFGKKKSQEEKE